ncbi:MAG TPA: competence/damage-inducible protein A [Vicinamibacterales bacterium]|nr:competence/damage-inducible protein A [Vicinamibacterales bacterium]
MKPLSRAAIIAVGSELLSPSKLDTNSLFVTERLNELGIDVTSKAIVGDDREELTRLLAGLLERVDLVILCGGLGPTDDDVTREAVAEALGRPLAEDEAITAFLRARFATRGFAMPMPENNRRQAMVPAGARVIQNPRGSAPGLWIEQDDRVVVLLPGPPRELRPMLTMLTEGWLRERALGSPLIRRLIRVTGRFESQVDEVLAPLYKTWAGRVPPIAATILATPGAIELHLSARHASLESATRALDEAVAEAVAAIGSNAYSTDGRQLEEIVGELLVAQGLRIGVAESCTGGLITSRLTDVPGSSRYVDASIVTYSNDSKHHLLGVPSSLIEQHGAVSEPVAIAMADGIRRRAPADIGVGVTGIAGPSGGTPEKPVGTVVVAVATASDQRVRTFRFHGERAQVKFQAVQSALDMVRRMLLDAAVHRH